jgi:hypothetical protein
MFNRHRLKRKWGRGVKRASNLVYVRNRDRVLKDFAWRKRKNNPFWRDEDDKIDWQKIVNVSVLAICVLGIILLLVFAPIFRITSVRFNGLQRIKYSEAKNAVDGVLNYHRFLFCPGNNYFLLNLNEVEDILKEKFSLNKIAIKKVFPNKLTVELEEKISTIIYDSGIEYSYLDIEGRMVEILKKVGQDEWREEKRMVTSTDNTGKEINEIETLNRQHNPKLKEITAEFGDYPLVFDERGITTTIGVAVLQKETVEGIIGWFNKIRALKKPQMLYFVIKNELGEAEIRMAGDWIIKTNLKKDIANQFDELQYLLKNKIKSHPASYIDLRFPGKAYWQ